VEPPRAPDELRYRVLSVRAMWWAAGLLVTVGVAMAIWLLLAYGGGGEQQRNQLEAIKTAGTVVLGAGGAAALLLAARRQRTAEIALKQKDRDQVHQERVAAVTEADATERRITDLYTKAADQLGSDKAPVRMAGLYALERLAQGNPSQRQTIVNVICAYLRMPFSHEKPIPATSDELETLSPERKEPRSAEDAAAAEHWSQERLVRLTAQSILTGHLSTTASLSTEWPRISAPNDPNFWPGIDIHLNEATLLDFSFAGARVDTANFVGTRFKGGANFAHANFERHAHFHKARFEDGPGHFLGAWFGLRAVFSRADFGEKEANFQGATFAGMVFLDDAAFGSGVTLEEARALADFDTNWGSARRWPAGWTERSLASDERMPQPYGRWADAPELPLGDPTWHLIVQDTRSPGDIS
jgi:hypothetical protein